MKKCWHAHGSTLPVWTFHAEVHAIFHREGLKDQRPTDETCWSTPCLGSIRVVVSSKRRGDLAVDEDLVSVVARRMYVRCL